MAGWGWGFLAFEEIVRDARGQLGHALLRKFLRSPGGGRVGHNKQGTRRSTRGEANWFASQKRRKLLEQELAFAIEFGQLCFYIFLDGCPNGKPSTFYHFFTRLCWDEMRGPRARLALWRRGLRGWVVASDVLGRMPVCVCGCRKELVGMEVMLNSL